MADVEEYDSDLGNAALVAPAEAEVHAAAHHVALERDVVVGDHAAAEAAIHVAEIHMEIFGLGGPIIGERELDAAAGGPAGAGLAGARKARRAGLDVAESDAAGHVGQEPVERIAGTAAHGGEPIIAGGATGRTPGRGGAALEVGPVHIAFEAEHRMAELPIDAGGAARDRARH